MAVKKLDKKEIEQLKNKPQEDLKIGEKVFLMELRITELEKHIEILIDAHTED